MLKQFRQGDVLFVKTSSPAEGELRKTTQSHQERMLVAGEHSNHGHFAMGDIDILDAGEEEMTIRLNGAGSISHLLIDSGGWTKEHASVNIVEASEGLLVETEVGGKKTTFVTEKGSEFKVVRQNQWNPYAKAIERVQD